MLLFVHSLTYTEFFKNNFLSDARYGTRVATHDGTTFRTVISFEVHIIKMRSKELIPSFVIISSFQIFVKLCLAYLDSFIRILISVAGSPELAYVLVAFYASIKFIDNHNFLFSFVYNQIRGYMQVLNFF